MTTVPLLSNLLHRSFTWISNSSRLPLHTGYQDLKHISASPALGQVKRSLPEIAFGLPAGSPHDQVPRNLISRLEDSQMQRSEPLGILDVQALQNRDKENAHVLVPFHDRQVQRCVAVRIWFLNISQQVAIKVNKNPDIPCTS